MPERRALEVLVRTGLITDPDSPEVLALVRRIEAARADGLDEDALMTLAQAYGRAVGRVSAAEAEIAVRRLADTPPADVEEALGHWLARVLPLSTAVFDTLHRRQLDRLVRRRLAVPQSGDDTDATPASVAFVDLCASTRFMLSASPADIRDLADAVYLAAQEVALHHDVVAAKYLGDGVLLVGRDGAQLLAAAEAGVRELAARTPLDAAGGVARGSVLRRAGDYYGPPVNLAARLAEVAEAGNVLVDEAALPGTATTWATVTPRGLDGERRAAVVTAYRDRVDPSSTSTDPPVA